MNSQDLLDKFSEGLSKDRCAELARELRFMSKGDAWQFVAGVLKSQHDARVYQMISTPLASLDNTLEQEYMKGEAAALLILCKLVDTLSEYLESLAPQDDPNEPESRSQ